MGVNRVGSSWSEKSPVGFKVESRKPIKPRKTCAQGYKALNRGKRRNANSRSIAAVQEKAQEKR